MSTQGLTPLGRWLARRGPFVRGAVYGFILPAYVVAGMWRGVREAISEWVDDRKTVLRASPHGTTEQEENDG